MCGLSGVLSKKQSVKNTEFLVALMDNSTHRGQDASGYAYMMRDHIYYRKSQSAPKEMHASNLKATYKGKNFAIKSGIGHVRKVTKGEPTDKDNNHPLHYKGFVLVHNGTVTNDDELVDEFKLKVPGKVDTRCIVGLIEKFYNETSSVEEAIKKTSELLKGSWAILLMYSGRPNTIFLARNISPLQLVMDVKGDRLLISSEINIADTTLKSFYGERAFNVGAVDFTVSQANPYYAVPNRTGATLSFIEDKMSIETFELPEERKDKTWLERVQDGNRNRSIDYYQPDYPKKDYQRKAIDLFPMPWNRNRIIEPPVSNASPSTPTRLFAGAMSPSIELWLPLPEATHLRRYTIYLDENPMSYEKIVEDLFWTGFDQERLRTVMTALNRALAEYPAGTDDNRRNLRARRVLGKTIQRVQKMAKRYRLINDRQHTILA